MKNLRLGIYTYMTQWGPGFGWRLVKLIPHTTRHQPILEIANRRGFKSRAAAFIAFDDMLSMLECVHSVKVMPGLVSQWGWCL